MRYLNKLDAKLLEDTPVRVNPRVMVQVELEQIERSLLPKTPCRVCGMMFMYDEDVLSDHTFCLYGSEMGKRTSMGNITLEELAGMHYLSVDPKHIHPRKRTSSRIYRYIMSTLRL